MSNSTIEDNHYYWIKVLMTFFENRYIKAIEAEYPGATTLYLKIVMSFINNNGIHCYEKLRPTKIEELSMITNIDCESLNKVLPILERFKLITRYKDRIEIYIVPEIRTGKETKDAERMRKKRAIEKAEIYENKVEQCSNKVHSTDEQISYIKEDRKKNIENTVKKIEETDKKIEDSEIETSENIEKVKKLFNEILDEGLLKKEETDEYEYFDRMLWLSDILTYGSLENNVRKTIEDLDSKLVGKQKYDMFATTLMRNMRKDMKQNGK